MVGHLVTTDQIEFHDSTVEFIVEADAIVLALRPAYVHHWEFQAGVWKGTGRTQEAGIRVSGGHAQGQLPSHAVEISGGSVRVGDDFFDNLIPVPLAAQGKVTVVFDLVDASPVHLTGSKIQVELIGPATDIEELPASWAPSLPALSQT